MVPINYWAVLLNVVIAMALGFVWYGPLFGKKWARLMGWSDEQSQAKMKESQAFNYGLTALGSLVMSFVLAHNLEFASTYLATGGISAGLMTGFWNWLGFVAPVTLGSVLWDGKPWMLWVINNGYWLIMMLLMGVVLALWV